MISMQQTTWRTVGSYLPTLASKAALLEETRLFLLTYDQKKQVVLTKQTLMRDILAQRSHETRALIAEIISTRLVRWNPPDWVLQDLVAFAKESDLDALRAALLLHVTRQDHLLYDFVQEVIVPRLQGDRRIVVADVQTFFDQSQKAHPEISHWSFETRLRLARGVLATLRDYGLLKGAVNKNLVYPNIPEHVVFHLIRLLQAEGIPETQMADHPDWHIWLWSSAQAAVARFLKQEHPT